MDFGSLFGFRQTADVSISLANAADGRKLGEISDENREKRKVALFYDGENVKGKVNVQLKTVGKPLEHKGIKVEFIGQIGEYLSVSCNYYQIN